MPIRTAFHHNSSFTGDMTFSAEREPVAKASLTVSARCSHQGSRAATGSPIPPLFRLPPQESLDRLLPANSPATNPGWPLAPAPAKPSRSCCVPRALPPAAQPQPQGDQGDPHLADDALPPQAGASGGSHPLHPVLWPVCALRSSTSAPISPSRSAIPGTTSITDL